MTHVVAVLSLVAGVAGQVLWQAIDLVFNFSGMWHDIQTLTDDNANWWAKAATVADLGVTVFTDINISLLRPSKFGVTPGRVFRNILVEKMDGFLGMILVNPP